MSRSVSVPLHPPANRAPAGAPHQRRPPTRATWLRQPARIGCCLMLSWLAGCVGDDAPADPYDVGGNTDRDAGTGGKRTDAAISSADAGEEVVPGSAKSHYPIVVGSSWTYHHENPTKQPWDEVDTIEAGTYMQRDVAVLTDEEDAQGQQTHSTLVVQGSGVYRVYKEVSVAGQLALKVSYDPAFLRYDEAWDAVGESMTLVDDWTQTCVIASSASKCAPGAVKPGSTTHVYKVLALDEEVTVPAGTFHTVKVQRINPTDVETKLFWYAAGVGKVREEDTTSGATEELTEYHIP